MASAVPALMMLMMMMISPSFATMRPSSRGNNIATMASSEEVPIEIVKSMCSKTKDPSFCEKFSKGDMQTFLGMNAEVRMKVLDAAIDITKASKEGFSKVLNEEKDLSPKEKQAIQNCIGLYTEAEKSLKSCASTSVFKTIEKKLEVAGESIWQCQMSLHKTEPSSNSKTIALLRLTNGLANSFVSYVQSEFYAHSLVIKH